MAFVIYVAPFFSEFSVRVLGATADLPSVRLAVINEQPEALLPAEVRDRIVGHWQVESVFDSGQVAHAAWSLSQAHGPIRRLFSALEPLQVPVAEARERLGVPGMSSEVARNFRDKARMKDLLRAASLPTARHLLAATEAEAWQFAAEIGYPLVVKPPAGAGSQATYQVESPEALRQALALSRPYLGQPVLLEEFITGDEATFDTFSLHGRPLWHSITHYYPTPLEVLRHPWIQWVAVVPREIDHARYDDIRQTAFKALDVLGMDTGMSHMEWFRRHDGSIAISEVGARPPGAQFTTLMSRANDFDCLGTWVRLMIDEAFDPPERRYAAGAAYLRAQGNGSRIVAIHGLEQADREVGHLVTDVKLPQIGQMPSRHYEGDGYIILRHPDTEVVRDALFRIISLVRVVLG